MSSTWMAERTITDAEAEARERLAFYQHERDERMAAYILAWQRKWAEQRAAAAPSTSPRALWRVK